VGLSGNGKALLWRGAARVEQEIRAYPRAYDLFYRALTRSPRARALAGRAKDRVRTSTVTSKAAAEPQDDPAVVMARERAAARRLGLAP
jgi:hypothetical protein